MKRLLGVVFFIACLAVTGCMGLGNGEKQKGKHAALVYEAAEQHVTFSYHLPYIDDYTIVNMQYTPQNEQYGSEEALFITYNANMFISPHMQKAIDEAKEINVVENHGMYTIYGPYYETDYIILQISIIMKKTPFEVVSPNRARSELYRLIVDDKEVLYDYTENMMTSHGNHAYYVFEVEKDGTYYRVYVQITTKMSEDEVKEKINELTRLILS